MHGKNRVKNPVTRHHLFKITLHHPFLKFGSSFARVSHKCNLELDVKLFSIVMNRYFKKKKRKKRDVNYGHTITGKKATGPYKFSGEFSRGVVDQARGFRVGLGTKLQFTSIYLL